VFIKKLFSSLLLVFIFVPMLSMFCSCGNNYDNLVGTWYYVSGETEVRTIVIYSDGTCLVDNESGNWSVTDETLKILGSYGGRFWDTDSFVGKYSISEDILTISDAIVDESSDTYDIVFSKSKNMEEADSKLYYLESGGVIGIMGFENDVCSSDISCLSDFEDIKFIEVTNKVVIPSKIDEVDVIAIDGGAFKNCSSIVSVTIPNSVTVIEPGAFDGCRDDLIIYCGDDSVAKEYAVDNGITYALN